MFTTTFSKRAAPIALFLIDLKANEIKEATETARNGRRDDNVIAVNRNTGHLFPMDMAPRKSQRVKYNTLQLERKTVSHGGELLVKYFLTRRKNPKWTAALLKSLKPIGTHELLNQDARD
jgi:hypothetical protein